MTKVHCIYYRQMAQGEQWQIQYLGIGADTTHTIPQFLIDLCIGAGTGTVGGRNSNGSL